MANYANLKAAVQAVIKTNGDNEITGAILQSTLLSIINEFGSEYLFAGVATPETSAGSPDQNVFYIGGAGTYANFGNSISVPNGSICIFTYNGEWNAEVIECGDWESVYRNLELLQVSSISQEDYDNLSVVNITDFIDQKAVDKSGNIVDNGYFKITGFIRVKEGQKLIVDGCYNDNGNFTQLISAFGIDGTIDLSSSVGYEMTGHYVYVVPAGVHYVIVSSLNNSSAQDVRLMDSLDFSPNRILLNDDDFADDGRFYTPSGNVETNTSYHSTEFVPIVGAKKMSVCANMTNPWIAGIAFFDKNLNFISSINNVVSSDKDIYDVPIADIPSNAVYCKVASEKRYSDYTFVDITTRDAAYINVLIDILKTQLYKTQKTIYRASASSLAQGSEVVVNDSPSARNSTIINAKANFSSFGQLMLYKGIEPYLTGEIKIDDTNLYAFSTTGSGAFNTYPHGLTISQFIEISVVVKNRPMLYSLTGTAVVKIVTAGGTFEQEVPWMGGKKVALLAERGNYTNVVVEYSVAKRRNWIFADSYADFWCPFINEDANILIDSYSGRNSYNAYLSLENELKTHLPDRIIWALGMNDGDTNNAVSTEWYYWYERVTELCQKYNIQLILCTIPNTPIITNYYKNQVIKSSGYEYIDIAEIVGASQIGSSWYGGLLGSDNVHPTDNGAKLIASYLSSYMI